ncbi:hypothetical protein ACFVGN_02295 [Streptomyces sp. NPDC057757]|uniref:hypothetical protein n=1 Tax=Streptomyces sp. NPDC057757 TaxID=3346241 RepID=UPI0036C384FD
MAKSRKGYYRAAHYVKPTTVSGRMKKPATWVMVVAAVLLIAAWNSLFGNDSDDATPQQQPNSPATKASSPR